MQDQQFIIDALEIGDWPEDKREDAVVEATMRIGDAMKEGLTEQQYNEYKAIADDHEAVINAWLEQNMPDYKSHPVYQAIEAGYDADPEHNNPAKIFATMAWVQQNVPDVQERIAKTLSAYKQELSA